MFHAPLMSKLRSNVGREVLQVSLPMRTDLVRLCMCGKKQRMPRTLNIARTSIFFSITLPRIMVQRVIAVKITTDTVAAPRRVNSTQRYRNT